MLTDPRKRGTENTERRVKDRTHRQQGAQIQQILNPKTEISAARVAEENWISKSEKKCQARAQQDGGEHSRHTLD
jgi:hypothetical protein